MDDDRLAAFWQDPISRTLPNGELVKALQERILNYWQSFLEQYLLKQSAEKSCLFIIHGSVQKVILADILSMPIQAVHSIEVPFVCCSVITRYRSESNLIITLKSHGNLT
jgi:broad specificity phosphatase PhoE